MKLDMYEIEQNYINEQKALRLKHGYRSNKQKRIRAHKGAAKKRLSSRDIIRAFGRSVLQEYEQGRGRIERNYEVSPKRRRATPKSAKLARY